MSTTSTPSETPSVGLRRRSTNGSGEPPWSLECAPDGYQWVLVPEARSAGARLTRTYAWRVFDDEEVLIEALAETFPSKKASEALRWVFAQPTVRQTIYDRIRPAK